MTTHITSGRNKVPLSARITWGSGGLVSYIMMNTLFALALPIYQVALKVDPVTLGLLMAIPRFVDLFFDPVMGNISDNTRTRWGRRRPYILAGAIGAAILLPLLWMPPFHTQAGIVAYFLVVCVLYTFCYTIFEIPYTALGYELTDDYDERTRVLAWRMYLGFIGMLGMPWVYKLCLSPIFKDMADPGTPHEVVGARWVSLGLSAVILLAAVILVVRCRESVAHRNLEKIGMIQALKCTIQNRAFMMLMGVNLVIRIGIAAVGAIPLYINLYYVCLGGHIMSAETLESSKGLAATIMGVGGTVAGLTSYIALPLATWLSVRTSKRTTLMTALGIALVGNASMWFTFDPQHPWLQLSSAVVANFGMMGCWLMMSSMVADICDEDELHTGLRREGVYGASVAFTEKLAFTITTAITGFVLALAGFNTLTADTAGVPLAVIMRMKVLLVASQVVAIGLGILGCWLYPITRARSEATRRILDARKGKDAINYKT